MSPHHTHTPPNAGDIPIYLDEFELPQRRKKLKYFAPCPCCSPRNRKFGKGKIAWFPGEGVIRLIGPDCFASLDKDAHENAVAALKARKQREAETSFLLKSHERLRTAVEIIKAGVQVGEAIQKFAKDLRYTVNESLNLPLGEYMRQGELEVWQETTTLDVRSGNQKVETGKRVYARIEGYKIFTFGPKDYGYRLRGYLMALAVIDTEGDWAAYVTGLSDQNRRALAIVFNRAIISATDAFAEMRDLQKFVGQTTVATIKQWGALPETVLPVIFDRKDSLLKIGHKPNALFSVQIPPNFEDELPFIDVPKLSDFEAD